MLVRRPTEDLMRTSRALVALAAAAGLLTPAWDPWDPGGGTTNGLRPVTYLLPNQAYLDNLMSAPLPAKSPLPIGKPDSQERLLLQDTIDCALAQGATWTPAGASFQSAGLLRWTTDWKKSPLSMAEWGDVHTCLITRLNYWGRPVPIYISGPKVAQGKGGLNDPNLYPYEEAAWVSVATANDVVKSDVWPLHDLSTSCAVDTAKIAAVINSRICSNPIGSLPPNTCTSEPGGTFWCPCGIRVHPQAAFSHDCSSDPAGGWKCKSSAGPSVGTRAAIATRLGRCGWKRVYSNIDGSFACPPPWGTNTPDFSGCDTGTKP
jgi:hypothetical protein